jgi:hypothetical protein
MTGIDRPLPPHTCDAKMRRLIVTNLIQFEDFSSDYQPRSAPYFNPDTITITKGSYQTVQRRNLVEAICGVYPKAQIIEKLDRPHNRVAMKRTTPVRTIGIFRHTAFVHTIANTAIWQAHPV